MSLDPGQTGQDARPVPGIDNGYLAGYRVRFDEAGADGLVRTSTLLRYAQDVAWRHSEQLGFDRGWYQARGLGWVVRGCELELHEPIPMGHTIRVSTAVVGHRRIWARRLGECRLADGRLAARVTTDWVLLDARNRIVRIPSDFGVAFTNPEVESEILRVQAASGTPAASISLAVRPSDLDPLDHVNNAVYVDWLEEALDAAGWREATHVQPRSYRLEYLASAERGDSVIVDLFGIPDTWTGRISRADGSELVRARGTIEG
jgi:acyl-ACP thioesterase